MAKIFNYHQDISIDFGNKSYKIQHLLYMSNQKFQKAYHEFNIDIGDKVEKTKESKSASLEMLAISHTIDMMERVRLERELNKLKR